MQQQHDAWLGGMGVDHNGTYAEGEGGNCSAGTVCSLAMRLACLVTTRVGTGRDKGIAQWDISICLLNSTALARAPP